MDPRTRMSSQKLIDWPSSPGVMHMLDLLEARIAAVRNHPACAGSTAAISPVLFRGQMDRLGLSSVDFARLFGLDHELVREWIDGTSPIPAWAAASLVLLGLLTPAARILALSQKTRQTNGRIVRTHPFARIEEL